MIDYGLENKRIVVTGASTGIGKAIVKQLVSEKAYVLAIARDVINLEQLKNYSPEKITTASVDVTNYEKLENEIVEYAAQGKISGSVHAAGFNKFTPLRAFDWSLANKMINTNLCAGIELLRILVKNRILTSDSSHVQISSVAALKGQSGMSMYSASKAGMLGAVRSLALELSTKTNARVNAISPGWVETPLTNEIKKYYSDNGQSIIDKHPLGAGDPKDVADAALFLLGDCSRWITGIDLIVDGGYSIN